MSASLISPGDSREVVAVVLTKTVLNVVSSDFQEWEGIEHEQPWDCRASLSLRIIEIIGVMRRDPVDKTFDQTDVSS